MIKYKWDAALGTHWRMQDPQWIPIEFGVDIELYKAREVDAELTRLRERVAELEKANQILRIGQDNMGQVIASHVADKVSLSAEIELRKAALRWALKHGAKDALDGRLSDSGCGCCSHQLKIPPEYAALIAEAMKP